MPPRHWYRRLSCNRLREGRGRLFPEDEPRRRRLLPEEGGERSHDECSTRQPHLRTEFARCRLERCATIPQQFSRNEKTMQSRWRALTEVDSEAGKGTCHAHHCRNRKENAKAKACPKNRAHRDSARCAHRAARHVQSAHARARTKKSCRGQLFLELRARFWKLSCSGFLRCSASVNSSLNPPESDKG